MAKLYPPDIDGSLPAAYLDKEGWHFTINYAMNRAVAATQTSGIHIIIKTISGSIVYESTISNSSIVDHKFNCDITDKSALNVGQYYKVQLAYVDLGGESGYFSTVGIMKGIAKPEVTIALEKHSINYFQGSFTGVYTIPTEIEDITINDLSERVYSYCFNIYDAKGKLYATSGELVHDSNTDSLSDTSLRTSYDVWTPEKFGEEDSLFYTIEYKITTLNNYVGTSSRYRLQMQSGLVMDPSMIIYPLPDYENGCVEVVLIGEPDETLLAEKKYTGSYLICRRVVSDYDDESWVELHRFRLTDQEPSTHTFRDFTVEQGVTYKYSIQQINSYGMFTSRVISPPVYADFEDMFLFDGRRVLRIRFNPKVASFKTTLQESKTDTIGSKYPYFFRNGNVAYKEFPISGLLSYYIDDAELFIKDAALGLEPERGSRGPSWVFGKSDNIIKQRVHEDDKEFPTADYASDSISYRGMSQQEKDRWLVLHPEYQYYKQWPEWVSKRKQDAEARVRTRNFTGYNHFAERKFKLTVLDWLNNGELKLFKSPGEGNYIVRLMNNSLSPMDQLGRLIHTFTSSAYEAADNSIAALLAAGIVKLDAATPVPEYQWETVWLHEGYNQIENKEKKYYTPIKVWDEDGSLKYISIKKPEGIISFEVHDLLHYDHISIHYKGNAADDFEDIVIGPTGNYIMQHEIKPIDEIRLLMSGYFEEPRPGHIDICFLINKTCNFDTIIGIEQDAAIARQIPGEGKNIMADQKYWYINNWDWLKISLRPLIPVFWDSDKQEYYIPPNYQKAEGDSRPVIRKYKNVTEQIIDDCGETWGIYRLYDAKTGLAKNTYWIWNSEEQKLKRTDNFIYDTRFAINGTPGRLDDNVSYVEYHHMDNIERLWLGTGVLAEASYQTFKLKYADEEA